jgi:catechol 2,3-dioxygenase-like lactoylglutathione lyase family enzyme
MDQVGVRCSAGYRDLSPRCFKALSDGREGEQVRFVQVRLGAAPGRIQALAGFYGGELGLDLVVASADRFSFAVGETAIEFVTGSGEPFYHFALLVPGNRFAEALEWASARTELLPEPGSGEIRFDFDNWGAYACYFQDPAGNIVELIAHKGVDESRAQGEFRTIELLGLSELGLVGDPPAMAALLAQQLGLTVWDGTVEEPGRLAFVGEQARTLILSPEGRAWLPTRRAAEPHPVEALLAGRPEGEVELEDARYRIRTAATA